MVELDDDFRKEAHYSHSALNLYLNCSLAYYFRYVAHLEPEYESKCLMFGSAFHRTLDRLAELKMRGTSFSISDAQKFFQEDWRIQISCASHPDFESIEEAIEMEKTGKQMLESYIVAWKDKKILSHGKKFKLELGLSKPVIGEYDLVVEENGKTIVVDFKTAGKKWDVQKPSKDLQATLYCLSYHRLFNILPGFRFDVITKAKHPSVQQLETSRAEDDFKRLLKLYWRIDAAIQGEVFIPLETGYRCGCCDFRKSCSTWHKGN